MVNGTCTLLYDVEEVTIEEFLSKPDNKNVFYMVTGTISSLKDSKGNDNDYGNMYITDGTNELYVYGCYPGWGATGDARKFFVADNDLQVGDQIAIIGYKDTYKELVELCSGVCFSFKKANAEYALYSLPMPYWHRECFYLKHDYSMKRLSLSVMFLLSVLVLWAQDQSVLSYYQAADGKKGAELKTAFFQIISPHEVQSYTPGVWNAINSYDIRPDGKIWDIYSGISNFTPKDDQDKGLDIDEEGVVYNREHAMPKSWFNEGSDATDYPMYTDLHHLFPTDRYVNTMRSNYPYGEIDPSTKPTKQSADGFSKFGICDPAIGYTVVNGKARVFEPNDEYKGDLARVYFYMATCYEAYKTGGGKNRSPKDWKSDMLTSDIYPFFTDWALKMLLRWAAEDPISEKEIKRNEAIYGIQKNRNPFVDYPGLEQYIWGNSMDVPFSYDHYAEPATAISNIHREMQPAADRVYDLKGRRVSDDKPRKGIYIRHGKKVVIR